MKKIKMVKSNTLTLEEGCNKYLDNCRARNLREGTINHYRQTYVQFKKFFDSEGDTIITLEVPRLARSTKQLCEIIEIVKEKKLKLIIKGSITVDCTLGRLDPMSNAFIQMSGVFAELELGMIRERVRSGMANAKAKGG